MVLKMCEHVGWGPYREFQIFGVPFCPLVRLKISFRCVYGDALIYCDHTGFTRRST